MTIRSTRLLHPGDHDAIKTLFAHDGGYHSRVEGRSADERDIADLVTRTPPVPEALDKFPVGRWAGQQLVAIIDFIDGYPSPTTGYIGLLLVDDRHRGKGHGRELVEHAMGLLPHVETWRLAVADTNRDPIPFWSHLGFTSTGETKPWRNSDGVEHAVEIFARPVRSSRS